jgi:hypothetical protein
MFVVYRGFEQKFALGQNNKLRTIIPWEGRRRSQYGLLLEERLPGQRQPVKAASREAGARNAPALRG